MAYTDSRVYVYTMHRERMNEVTKSHRRKKKKEEEEERIDRGN